MAMSCNTNRTVLLQGLTKVVKDPLCFLKEASVNKSVVFFYVEGVKVKVDFPIFQGVSSREVELNFVKSRHN